MIEAVFEDRKVKAETIKKAQAVIGDKTIFASNTSTLPITSLADEFKDPARFIGIHFFSPVERMMLVEIILGKKTGDVALATALDFVRAIRKTPIVVNDSRGFFANRCVLNYIQEGHLMFMEGVPAAMIENVGRMAGMPVGPLSLNDEVALDLGWKILKATEADLGPKAVNPQQKWLLQELVEKRGRLGRKNGKGFYDYPQGSPKRLWPGLAELQPKKLDPDKIDIQELKHRLLVVQSLEAARCVEEGVITDVREADVGSILGFGFAPFTGGTLSYIDMMGTKRFVDSARSWRRNTAPRFKPPKLLHRHGAEGRHLLRPLRAGRRARRRSVPTTLLFAPTMSAITGRWSEARRALRSTKLRFRICGGQQKMRSRRSSGHHDGNVACRVRPGSSCLSASRSEPGQNQSLKSPSITVGKRVAARDRDQPPGLGAALGEAQSEMGGDHANPAAAAMHFGLDRAARLAVGMGDVVDLGGVERTAADQHLAVVAIGGADRLGLDAVIADRLAQQFERRARAGGPAAGIDLLQRHHIGIVPVDRLGDAFERKSCRRGRSRRGCSRSSRGACCWICAVTRRFSGAARHQRLDSERGADPGDHRQHEQAHIERRRRGQHVEDLVAERRHQHEAGQHAEDGAEHVVGERNPAGAGGKIDDGERRHRHHAHGGDREHAVPRDGAADAVEPRAEHVFERLAVRSARRRHRS